MVPLNITTDKLMQKNWIEADSSHRLPMVESCLKHKSQKADSILGLSLASTEGNYPVLRNKMSVEGPIQTLCRPVPHPDSGYHNKPQQKKAIAGYGTGQMPQSLLSELSTVLHQTGRTPREES